MDEYHKSDKRAIMDAQKVIEKVQKQRDQLQTELKEAKEENEKLKKGNRKLLADIDALIDAKVSLEEALQTLKFE